MIRLKSLITEVGKSKLNVLFVGDHQTMANWSYAKQLIADGTVTGKIVGWTNATTAQLYRILKSNMSKRYDVISIMGGDSDAKSFDANTATSNLDRCYTLAEQYGAKVVAISNPTKIYLTQDDKFYSDTMYPSNDIISNWVVSQSKPDIKINTLQFEQDAFSKDNYRLNAAANRVIANQWKSAVSSLNIQPRSKKMKLQADVSLRLGDTGPAVRELHEKLVDLGFDIKFFEMVSAVFGNSTLLAVITIQKSLRLPVTGVVSTETIEAINKMAPIDDESETDSDDEATERPDKLSGTRQEYISKYAPLAVEQMEQYGIPASITLAQGILESANGTSDLTVYAYNHFGIKGEYNGKKWCGKTKEVEKGKKVVTKACFKRYPDDESSFKDHSELLLGARYQQKVKQLATGPTDYKGWAKALQAAGYATDPSYAQTLINLIVKYNLDKYDAKTSTSFKPAPSKATGENGRLSMSQLKSVGGGHKLNPAAADAYLAMKQASYEDGLKDSDWDLSDSYRTYAQQDAGFDWELYNKTGEKAKKGTNGKTAMAYPGTSNHGLGKAIDLWGKAQEWVRKNGEQFGWSWDEGKSVGEPWHFRYKL